MEFDYQKYLDGAVDAVVTYTPKVLAAIAVLYVGLWLIRKVNNLLEKALHRAKVNETAIPFLASFVGVFLKIMLFLSVAGMVGIKLTALFGILAAAGFAIGMALQGSLANFAAGILILFFKPYKLRDWVEVDERFGIVESIGIFNTNIVTPGNKTLIIPNGKVVEGIITNYSDKGYIRIDLEVAMGYAESFPRVKEIILEAIREVPGVLTDPEPEVGIDTFDSHTVILSVRPYATPDDFWEVKFECHQRIKTALSRHKIQMAYSEGVELGSIGE